ncbi:MAG: HAD family phosphatase [Bacteroidaceae bacterium]|nr:HAD family phosphatase [Bacteroidaceae bacterium]
MPKSIHTIILDLGGVLLDLNMPRSLKAFEALGIDTQTILSSEPSDRPSATICEGLSATGAMLLYQIGKITTDQFLTGLLSLCHPGTTHQQVLDAWNACLLDIPLFKLKAIQQLRQQGYKLCLLSNTNEAHWQRISQDCFPQPPAHYFDHLFLSQEMGLAKPDPLIFQTVLQQIDAQPQECLFIDDAQVNCDAAAALGIHTYKTDRARLTPQDSIVRPANDWTNVIHRLLSDPT